MQWLNSWLLCCPLGFISLSCWYRTNIHISKIRNSYVHTFSGLLTTVFDVRVSMMTRQLLFAELSMATSISLRNVYFLRLLCHQKFKTLFPNHTVQNSVGEGILDCLRARPQLGYKSSGPSLWCQHKVF